MLYCGTRLDDDKTEPKALQTGTDLNFLKARLKSLQIALTFQLFEMWFELLNLFIYLKIRRRQQRQRQKAMSLVCKTTTLHVHHAFLYIS